MQAKVSFTQKVKEEISSLEFSDEHLRALLAAFIKINGSLILSNKKESISLKTENAKIAKFIYHSIEKIYGVPCRFAYSKAMNFKRHLFYNVIIEHADFVISDLEISFIDSKIAKNIVVNDDMISGYLCGAFLASGSCNSPKKSNYHLEVALTDESYAHWFSKLFLKFKGAEFTPKVIKRRNQYVVYIKRSQQISDFLIMIGATNTALEFENVRISRDFSNIGNRLSNLDSANLERTSKAAKNQLHDIKVIDKILGIEKISNKKQKALMKLRLEYEDASLQELANHLSEKLNAPISRSNVNHLFRAIHLIAIQYEDAYNDRS